MLVTVIVPVYKTEDYLDRCVSSIVNQTYRDLEIILVDDGSPDRCPELCDRWSRQDSRIKVIHQENGGLSAARNAGIRAATGAYIGFVDSDDWVNPDMYRRLCDAAIRCGADIAVGGRCDIVDGKMERFNPHPLAGKTLTGHEEIMEIRKNLYGHRFHDPVIEAFPMTVWNGLYKRDLLDKHSLFFENVLSEDTIFNLDVYRAADVITFTASTDYCYRKGNQGSITNTVSDATAAKYQKFLALLAEKAAAEEDPECVIRARRTAIDHCRMYVGLVERSGESFRKKKQTVRQFAENPELFCRWKGYPLNALPVQQRLLHAAVVKKYYGAALVLCSLRRLLGNCRKGRI